MATLKARKLATAEEQQQFGTGKFIDVDISADEAEGYKAGGYEIIGLPKQDLNPAQISTPKVKEPLVQAPIQPKQQPISSPSADLPDEVKTMFQNTNALQEQQIQTVQDQYEKMKEFADAQLTGIINNINDSMNSRLREQKVLNQARLGGQTKLGFRSGRARYAPEIQSSILGKEESEGLARLNSIEVQRQGLIGQAKSAALESDWKMFNESFTKINALQQQKQETLLNQYALAKQAEEQAYQRSRQAIQDEREAFKFNLEIEDRLMEQQNTVANILASDLVSLGSDFSVIRPNQGQIEQLALEANIDPNILGGMVNKTIQELEAFSAEQRADRLDQLNTQSLIAKREFDMKREELLLPFQQQKLGLEAQKMMTDIERLHKISTGEILSEDAKKLLFDLRSEANKDADIKGFIDIRDAYDRVQAAAESPSAAGDLALIFNYMKILDPASVVREGEFANAQNAGSIPERIRAQYNKTLEGTRLTDSQRDDFVDRANRLFQPKLRNYEKAIDFYQSEAREFGVPEDRVVRDFLTPSVEQKGFTSIEDFSFQATPEQKQLYLELDHSGLFKDADPMDIISYISGQDFNSGASASIQRSDVSDFGRNEQAQAETAFGRGTVTGIDGSKFWKHGLDFFLKGGKGASVVSPIAGTIIDVIGGFVNPKASPLSRNQGKKQNKGFGNQVKIKTSDGKEVWISHLDSVANLSKGQEIRPGMFLGRQGNTGMTYGRTGAHLDITMKDEKGNLLPPRKVASYFNTQKLS